MKTFILIPAFVALFLWSCKKQTRINIAAPASGTVSHVTGGGIRENAVPVYFQLRGFDYYLSAPFISYRALGGC